MPDQLAEFAGLEIAEQRQALEELLALWRNHDPCYLLFLDLLMFLVVRSSQKSLDTTHFVLLALAAP